MLHLLAERKSCLLAFTPATAATATATATPATPATPAATATANICKAYVAL